MGAGAGVYALVEGPGGATFYITPLFVGLTAVVAGLVGTIRYLIASGLSVVGWGIAVLLVHYNTIPAARTTPAYMVGIVVGVLAIRLVAPVDRRAEWMTAASVSAVFGSVGYFLAFDLSWLGRWPAWCLTLLAWALYEGGLTLRRHQRAAGAFKPSTA